MEYDLYPNPTSGLTNLSISASKNETVEITILNNLGQLVYVSKNNVLNAGSNNISLNTENWEAGAYYVNVLTTDKMKIFKLIIVK